MKKIIYLLAMILLIIACDNQVLVTPLIDNDGNEFDTINIGTQSWMQRNLNSAHYRNGDPIPEITNGSLWSSLTSGAWCWYKNDSVTYGAIYGKLYNWYAVNDPRGLAPVSWHIPSEEEWDELGMHLGPHYALKLREANTLHWTSPNSGATNSSGFTALPGGYRGYNGFDDVGDKGFWWTSTEDSALWAWIRDMSNSSHWLEPHHYFKSFGFSVRCVSN